MPRAKKSAAKSARKITKSIHETIDAKTENLFPAQPLIAQPTSGFYAVRWAYLIIAILLVSVIYLATKGYVVSATVDGQPIFGWELTSTLMQRYGSQTLDSMISERLVATAANKAGIVVGQKDIDSKINELIKSLGASVKLEDLLAYQGITKGDFEKQVRLQLTVEQLLGKDVKVTDAEIDTYLETNKDTLTATDEGAMRLEAKQTLFSQAVSQKIQPWFTELKTKAKIVKLLK
jgi:hypothetical protein